MPTKKFADTNVTATYVVPSANKIPNLAVVDHLRPLPAG